MKNILFIITSFRHGGTNKSLENLLSLINTEKYQADVFAMEYYGPYKEMLPNCTILPKNKWLNALIAHFTETKGVERIRSLIVKVIRLICNRFNIDISNKIYKKTIDQLLMVREYDAIIAYSEGVPTAFVAVINHFNKIAWIHCDYNSYMALNNNPDENEIYQTYKTVICVSEYTKKQFINVMPSMEKKTLTMYNLLNVKDIQFKADLKPCDLRFKDNGFNILSIGTFYPIKRISSIPDIAKTLLEKNLIFTWYVIGSLANMNEFKIFTEKISKYKLDDHVIYLGEKKNPYPYLKNSDLFVSLSMTEACPYVINESKALNLPIVCTNFPSAYEFVDNGVVGSISPITEIADSIEVLINDSVLYKSMKSNIEKISFDNKIILDKFYNQI